MKTGIDFGGTPGGVPDEAVPTRAVLLVTADEVAAQRVLSMLPSPWRLSAVGTLAAATASPALAACDVAIVDPFLPDSQGTATYEALRAARPRLPVLVLVEPQQEELAWQLERLGAQDHVLKEHLDGYWLARYLRRVVERTTTEEARLAEEARALLTLDSIGDAVLSVDAQGRVSFLNAVAEGMTGWLRRDALGRPATEVLHLIDRATRDDAPSPLLQAMRENRIVGLAANTDLLGRDGTELAIEDSSAPIRDHAGRVTGAVVIFRDLCQSRRAARRMVHLAQHDSLTDLPNRLLLNARIAHAALAALRHDRNGAVLFVDLDDFKTVNDTYGHAVGDELLRVIAQRIRASVRASDTVARLGGDEFVVLLEETEQPGDASISAAKVLEAIAIPCRIEGHELRLTASIGIGEFPQDACAPDALLRCADAAMYAAKAQGRNQVRAYADTPLKPVSPQIDQAE